MTLWLAVTVIFAFVGLPLVHEGIRSLRALRRLRRRRRRHD
ncbi:MAG: hypothetical protein QN190_14125 [Armatimonadota bacterium]|nr:hypothetical protein [Armatimonadota bacterium]